MTDLILRRPRLDEEAEVMRAHRATSADELLFLHYHTEGMPHARYLEVLEEQERGVGLPSPNHVPSTFLFAFLGPRVVGLATRILAQSLRIAHERLGIPRALLTCDEDNVASRRVIEKNGGVLENVVSGPDLVKPKRRYWIETSSEP